MANILDKIIEHKKQEVMLLQGRSQTIEKNVGKNRSLIKKLETAEHISIISEFKRSSPSKGIINTGIEPAKQAQAYERYGASAISVLTDKNFFQGSFEDLKAVREAVDLPILCKDFMIDSLQIDQASFYGADVILLIVAALDDVKLNELYQYSKDLGLEALVEVHNESELERALSIGAQLVGVNNRDLKTFEVSVDVTERLASTVKKAGAYLVSESGIHCSQDVIRVRDAGANAILVGEALMRSSDVQKSFSEFLLPLAEGAKR